MAGVWDLRVLLHICLSALYVIFRPEPSLLAVVMKIGPILFLSILVSATIFASPSRSNFRYDVSVFTGLCLSAAGDTALVFAGSSDRFFILGLLLFAVAHICYIIAFGFKPFNVKIFAVCFAVASFTFSLMYSGAAKKRMTVPVLFYCYLIVTMVWRALARRSNADTRENWSRSAIGAILFFISDFIIGYNKFCSPVPHAQVFIMTTYYAAQVGIASSVFGRSAKPEKASI